MFPVEERNRVLDRLIEKATDDPRVVSAAVVGSLALAEGDRWSDVDLSLGVADEVPVAEVMDEWTDELSDAFGAVMLFELLARGTIYRVFLLADWVQVDLSFTPASGFRQGSPRFRLLFGTHQTVEPPADSGGDLFGWAVIFARHALVCTERGRLWQAAYCIDELRNRALALACLRRDLPTGFGRGFDDLPVDVLAGFDGTFVRSVDRNELLRALASAVDALLRESDGLSDVARQVAPQLRELAAASERNSR